MEDGAEFKALFPRTIAILTAAGDLKDTEHLKNIRIELLVDLENLNFYHVYMTTIFYLCFLI